MSVTEQPGDKIVFAWVTDNADINYKLCYNGVGFYLVRDTPRLTKTVRRYQSWDEAVQVVPDKFKSDVELARQLYVN